MPNPQVQALVAQIRRARPECSDIESAVEKVRLELEGFGLSIDAELAEAKALIEQQDGPIEILHTDTLAAPRIPWYFGPKPADRHWPQLRAYLENTKGWGRDSIDGIDRSSDEIVSLLGNPGKPEFRRRGLVVGHVQSGKTANMTAVMAKALDAGYNTVIVLAGLTNKLRFQTQTRLVGDLVARDPIGWHVLSPQVVDEDFRVPAYGGIPWHTDKAQLAVIKKNVSPLDRLVVAIQQTPPVALRRLRILLIDDECDQASVNAARGALDMTAINQRIRELLGMLPAVSYVGYTATPFANVLINPYPAQGPELDDLYPRDFITALPTPSAYFGTERLFGRVPVDAGNLQPEEEGLDMIRTVPDDEQQLLQPPSQRQRDAFYPELAPSLETAILYFLACCAARRARGDSDSHATMLVHTSAYVVMHERLAGLIKRWKEGSQGALLRAGSELSQRLRQLWEAERRRLPTGITDAPPVDIDGIRRHLPAVLDRLEVPVENGASSDRIDYGGAPQTYIVVGGSILARGLTLEGLMVSYFLRTSNQYDTLLQMGRWFGYRPGYEDLPRIWMTEDLKLRFTGLAAVEAEVRDEIAQYRRLKQTPMDVAVRIRTIPGMAITSAGKMRAARRCAVSFWGAHRQTFCFERRNARVLGENWNAAAELVSDAQRAGLRAAGLQAKLWRGVPKSSVRKFLAAYCPHAGQEDLSPDTLTRFLDEGGSRLDRWHVGIVEAARGNPSARTLGAAGEVRLVTRSRLRGTGEIANIKALMSKRDICLDCPRDVDRSLPWGELKEARRRAVGDVPLLLLYAIDKSSQRQRGGTGRVALDAIEDVLGYGVVFPGSVAESGSHVSVELDPPSADELAEMDAEHEAQAEAAHVI
ncbi:MAG: Z1 domain-containing protein [Bryobacterales bacterium]|nr:Z1 domain-containing protein [Bryobacterales bacterium]